MKKLAAYILCISLICSIFSGCAATTSAAAESENQDASQETTSTISLETDTASNAISNPQPEINWNQEVKFTGMADPSLPRYLEDAVYTSLVSGLNSEQYFVEDVQAVYVSQEYLEELAFNSQGNVFFGYSLAELDQFFEGTRYVFTLGEDGSTVVEPLQVIPDTTYDQILKNVAIGTGVILLCVTVSAVSGGAGAPAVSMIFAVAAKTGGACALSGTAIGGFSSALVKWLETGDMDETLKAGALGASEGYKWGAISGSISGAAKEMWGLYSASHASRVSAAVSETPGDYLTMNQVAKIQQESGYPLELIKEFHRMDEYKVFKDAGLQPQMINGKTALVRTDIDLNLRDSAGKTNLERMLEGYAPLDATGKAFELHHVGQKDNGVLAILTAQEHQKNSSILHRFFTAESQIDRSSFNKTTRPDFWRAMAKAFTGGA